MSEKVKAKKPLNPRAKNWCFELYPQDNEKHKYILGILSSKYNCLYIKHGSDVWTEDVYDDEEVDDETGEYKLLHKAGDPKKEHYHCVLQFENARYKNALVDELGIERNLLFKLSSFKNYVVYLTHRDYPNKAQYDIDDFHGSLKQKALMALAEDTPLNELREIINFINSYQGYISHKTVHNFVFEYGYLKTYKNYFNCIISFEIGEHNEAYFKSLQNKENLEYKNF